jgi:hypothetical protein
VAVKFVCVSYIQEILKFGTGESKFEETEEAWSLLYS